MFRLGWSSPQPLVPSKGLGARAGTWRARILDLIQREMFKPVVTSSKFMFSAVAIMILVAFGGRYVIKLIRVSPENIHFRN